MSPEWIGSSQQPLAAFQMLGIWRVEGAFVLWFDVIKSRAIPRSAWSLSSDSPGRKLAYIESQLIAGPCIRPYFREDKAIWSGWVTCLELHISKILQPHFEPSSPNLQPMVHLKYRGSKGLQTLRSDCTLYEFVFKITFSRCSLDSEMASR